MPAYVFFDGDWQLLYTLLELDFAVRLLMFENSI